MRCRVGFVLQVIEYLADHHRVLDTGDYFHRTGAFLAEPDVGVEHLLEAPGSPWEKGYNESYKGKLRDELLNRENFYTL